MVNILGIHTLGAGINSAFFSGQDKEKENTMDEKEHNNLMFVEDSQCSQGSSSSPSDTNEILISSDFIAKSIFLRIIALSKAELVLNRSLHD